MSYPTEWTHVFAQQIRETVQQMREKFELDGPYILFVGSLEPRKNLKMLLEAWQLGDFDGATLAVVGASGHLFQKLQFDSIPEGVRLLGRVEDELLAGCCIRAAAGFVYPSVYEGFGLPPLEAMACGCPVAVSDIPAHREVCGVGPSILIPSIRKIFPADWNCSCGSTSPSRASYAAEGTNSRLRL